MMIILKKKMKNRKRKSIFPSANLHFHKNSSRHFTFLDEFSLDLDKVEI